MVAYLLLQTGMGNKKQINTIIKNLPFDEDDMKLLVVAMKYPKFLMNIIKKVEQEEHKVKGVLRIKYKLRRGPFTGVEKEVQKMMG